MQATEREAAAIKASAAKACCKAVENLSRADLGGGKVVNICRVCGCRHFRLTVRLGVEAPPEITIHREEAPMKPRNP